MSGKGPLERTYVVQAIDIWTCFLLLQRQQSHTPWRRKHRCPTFESQSVVQFIFLDLDFLVDVSQAPYYSECHVLVFLPSQFLPFRFLSSYFPTFPFPIPIQRFLPFSQSCNSKKRLLPPPPPGETSSTTIKANGRNLGRSHDSVRLSLGLPNMSAEWS